MPSKFFHDEYDAPITINSTSSSSSSSSTDLIDDDSADADPTSTDTDTDTKIIHVSKDKTSPPPPPPFPTTLSQISHFTSNPQSSLSLYTTLKSIRTHTLSIHNRLTSILSDSTFTSLVSQHYDLPLIANERCGSWYIPPHLRLQGPSGSVYFKSTDGHHGQWSFSLRRLNLQLLKVLGEHGGAVVVDSTRRGKGLSDALAKTVPIWVAVINAVLFPETESKVRVPESVGGSERVQIEGRLEGWCEAFRGLGLDLERLRRECKRPIRVVWAVNGEWDGEGVEEKGDENLLVLCSASRRVRGAEASEGGYIQGAGDDSEGWSRGLTPGVFWKHKELLMETKEEELPELIDRLLREDNKTSGMEEEVMVKPTSNIFICSGTRSDDGKFDVVINCNGNSGNASDRILDLKCRDGKLGSKDLRDKIGTARSFAATTLERNPDCRILVTCSTGRDLSIGVALALLCLFFNDSGNLRSIPGPVVIDKPFIKSRLAWITSSKPDANLSRSTLQAVNSFLIGKTELKLLQSDEDKKSNSVKISRS